MSRVSIDTCAVISVVISLVLSRGSVKLKRLYGFNRYNKLIDIMAITTVPGRVVHACRQAQSWAAWLLTTAPGAVRPYRWPWVPVAGIRIWLPVVFIAAPG